MLWQHKSDNFAQLRCQCLSMYQIYHKYNQYLVLVDVICNSRHISNNVDSFSCIYQEEPNMQVLRWYLHHAIHVGSSQLSWLQHNINGNTTCSCVSHARLKIWRLTTFHNICLTGHATEKLKMIVCMDDMEARQEVMKQATTDCPASQTLTLILYKRKTNTTRDIINR